MTSQQEGLRQIMSSTTISYHGIETHTRSAASKPAKPGFLARLIEARYKQAEAHVQAYLAWLPESRLKDLNLSTDEVKAIQAKRNVPVGYWI
jgi:hypothetical protein